MRKTHVYLLVPEYSGITGTIQAAYDLASEIEPNGPIQFHLIEYPEGNPKEYMLKHETLGGMRKQDISGRFVSVEQKNNLNDDFDQNLSLADARENRKWLENSDQIIERMSVAEDWFFSTFHTDRKNSLVVLLNPYGNSSNYFCGPSPERSNVAFIQTTHYATETLTSRHVPVAYEMFAAAMRFRAFNVFNYQERFVHKKDRGCINDLCIDIRNIRLKILSADICEECYGRVQRQELNPLFIDHVFKGFEAVRTNQNSFTRARRNLKVLSATISMKHIKFGGIGAIVSLAPKEMTLYKFYLNHPEGISYKDICDYRSELFDLYSEHYQQTHSDNAHIDQKERYSSINAVLDRWCIQDEDLMQTISKINRKIKNAVTDELAQPHQILGPRGGLRKIKAIS